MSIDPSDQHKQQHQNFHFEAPDVISRIARGLQSYMTVLEKSRFFSHPKNLILLERSCGSQEEDKKLNYHLTIRNRIVDIWFANKGNQLTDEDILGVFGSNDYAMSLFKFLNIAGIINYGISRYSVINYFIKNRRPKISIIGAGISGIIAAQQLQKYNFEVIILESKQYIGGRMSYFNKYFDHNDQEFVVDIGCKVTHSGNPYDNLDVIIQQLNLGVDEKQDIENEYILDVTSRVIPNSIVKTYVSFLKKFIESYLIFCEQKSQCSITFQHYLHSVVKHKYSENINLNILLIKEMHNFYDDGINKLQGIKKLYDDINEIRMKIESTNNTTNMNYFMQDYQVSKYKSEINKKIDEYAKSILFIDEIELTKDNYSHIISEYSDLIDFEQIKICLSILFSYELNGGFKNENLPPHHLVQAINSESSLKCTCKNFIDKLLQNNKQLNIKTGCEVLSINYMNDRHDKQLPPCKLTYKDLDNSSTVTIESDYILSTMPLNVLKNNQNMFDPPLPSWKTQIINDSHPIFDEKIIIFLRKKLWNNKNTKIYNSLAAESSRTIGQMRLIFHKNEPVIEILYRHNGSKFMSFINKESVLNHISFLIKTITRQNPEILSSVFTNWCNDPFALGSSSTLPLGCYEIGPLTLGCPLKNLYGKKTLYFGGDYTSVNHFGRLRGAVESGLYQASEIIFEEFGNIFV